MPSAYLTLRSEPNKRGEHEIRIMIVLKRKPVPIKTGYFVERRHWDEHTRTVKRSHPNAATINDTLTAKLFEVQEQYSQLDRAGIDVTADTLKKNTATGGTFLSIALHYANGFREKGKIGTADAYESRAKKIDGLFPGILASQMSPMWCNLLNEKLGSKAHNTGVGLRKFINSVLNKAERDGFIGRNPFEKAVKGSYRTPDRGRLSKEDIEALWMGKPADKNELLAKLTFLFSYYAAGARFKDVLLMSKKALYMNGKAKRLRWKPSKTEESGEIIDIAVSPRLAKLIKLADNSSSTIFGAVPPGLSPADQDKKLASVQSTINSALKAYSARCGVSMAISFHDARRALAHHLKVRESDIYTIKDVLGHSSISVTQGYVGRNQKGVDDALKRIYK